MGFLRQREPTEKKADTTPAAEKSMPPPQRAPPGPPLPKVKEVKKEIPQPAPLGRSTPEAADPAAALAAIKAAAAAAGNVLKRTPDDPLKHLPGGFTKEQVMTEIKALEAYPMTEEEATKEFQSKQIPYDQRTFKKDKVEIVKAPEKKPDPKANPLTAPPTRVPSILVAVRGGALALQDPVVPSTQRRNQRPLNSSIPPEALLHDLQDLMTQLRITQLPFMYEI